MVFAYPLPCGFLRKKNAKSKNEKELLRIDVFFRVCSVFLYNY